MKTIAYLFTICATFYLGGIMQQQEDKKVQENEYLTVYTADDILYIYPTKKEISFESGHTMTFQTQDQMKLFIENETARQINN